MSELLYGDSRLPERFWVKVNPEPNTGCWLWSASTYRGYGRYSHQGKPQWAYAVAYKVLVGPVPDGLELDHTCRTPPCVRPDHLEPVTHVENMRRGQTFRHWSERTHCKNNHEFTPENTRPIKGGGRCCKQCVRDRGAIYSKTEKGRQSGRKRSARYAARRRAEGNPGGTDGSV